MTMNYMYFTECKCSAEAFLLRYDPSESSFVLAALSWCCNYAAGSRQLYRFWMLPCHQICSDKTKFIFILYLDYLERLDRYLDKPQPRSPS